LHQAGENLIWFRGYSTVSRLLDIVSSGEFDSLTGNYLCIVYSKKYQTLSIHHDNLPGFNILYTESLITNLYPTGYQVDYDEAVFISSDSQNILTKHLNGIKLYENREIKFSIKEISLF
jgi:hypothetical protein